MEILQHDPFWHSTFLGHSQRPCSRIPLCASSTGWSTRSRRSHYIAVSWRHPRWVSRQTCPHRPHLLYCGPWRCTSEDCKETTEISEPPIFDHAASLAGAMWRQPWSMHFSFQQWLVEWWWPFSTWTATWHLLACRSHGGSTNKSMRPSNVHTCRSTCWTQQTWSSWSCRDDRCVIFHATAANTERRLKTAHEPQCHFSQPCWQTGAWTRSSSQFKANCPRTATFMDATSKNDVPWVCCSWIWWWRSCTLLDDLVSSSPTVYKEFWIAHFAPRCSTSILVWRAMQSLGWCNGPTSTCQSCFCAPNTTSSRWQSTCGTSHPSTRTRSRTSRTPHSALRSCSPQTYMASGGSSAELCGPGNYLRRPRHCQMV